jgi:hypothetical protein
MWVSSLCFLQTSSSHRLEPASAATVAGVVMAVFVVAIVTAAVRSEI